MAWNDLLSRTKHPARSHRSKQSDNFRGQKGRGPAKDMGMGGPPIPGPMGRRYASHNQLDSIAEASEASDEASPMRGAGPFNSSPGDFIFSKFFAIFFYKFESQKRI